MKTEVSMAYQDSGMKTNI